MVRLNQAANPWPAAGIILSVCLSAMFAAVLVVRQMAWKDDFSTEPPAHVFQLAFGQPPPPGVTDIKAAGRRYASKQWMWLRFQATDPAMKYLASLAAGGSGDAMPAAAALERLNEQWSANSRYDDTDRESVGWSNTQSIAHPIYYDYTWGSAETVLWQGKMVFDYENHIVYVNAHGD